jgi:hypothetical protein
MGIQLRYEMAGSEELKAFELNGLVYEIPESPKSGI